MEILDERAEEALLLARETRRKLEGNLTVDKFIEDTTSSFMCFSWRKGTPEQRQKFEGKLDAIENEHDIVARVRLLKDLRHEARMERSDSDKFRTALERIRDDANELIGILEKTPEYLEYLDEQERLRLAEEVEAARQEELRIRALGEQSYGRRVELFKARYGTSGLLDTLLTGIEDGGMGRLVANFRDIGFKYTMKSVASSALITGRTDGDCSTVSGAMALIANEILMVKSRVASCPDLLVDSTTRTIDGAKEPTGHLGAFWVFSNHFWVESGGGQFDPLFGGALDQSAWNLLKSKFDVKPLNLSVEDYGGKYKVIFLLGAGGMQNMLAETITSGDWDTHCQKAHVDGVSFEQFKAQVGI